MMLDVGILEKNILEIIGCLEEEETLKKIINETVKRFGKIDVLVKN